MADLSDLDPVPEPGAREVLAHLCLVEGGFYDRNALVQILVEAGASAKLALGLLDWMASTDDLTPGAALLEAQRLGVSARAAYAAEREVSDVAPALDFAWLDPVALAQWLDAHPDGPNVSVDVNDWSAA
jgi:hypothetical protein